MDDAGIDDEESIPFLNGHDAGVVPAIERARETLARTAPTPESIAEHEERRRANRTAAIMAPRAPSPRLVFRVNENSLVPSRAAAMDAVRAKVAAGERLTRADRIAVWADAIDAEIAPLLKAGKLRAANVAVVQMFAAHSVAQREMIDRLEDRIAALEAAARRE